MAGLWFCKLAGVTTGPLKPSALRALAESGKLAPDDLVRQGTEGPWVPARHVRGLFVRQVPGGLAASGESVSSGREEVLEGAAPSGTVASANPQGGQCRAVPTARLLPQPPPVPDQTPPESLEDTPSTGEKSLALDFTPQTPLAAGSHTKTVPLTPVLPYRRQQNNVLMIVGLAVTAVALLVVVVLLFTGVIPLGMQSSGAQKKPSDVAAPPALANQEESSAPSEISWVDAAKKGIRRGTTSVSILSARLAPAPASWVEKPGEYLLLDVQVKNQAEDKILFFAGWSRAAQEGTLLKLADNKGGVYRQIPRMDALGSEDSGGERILPGGSAKDTLVFEPPKDLETLKYFRLELPGRAFPKETFRPFHFQISAQMIRTGGENSGPAAKPEELFGPPQPADTSGKKAPSKPEPETPPIPQRKRDPGQEELERLMKELGEQEKPSPSGAEREKPSQAKPSAAGEETGESSQSGEPSDSKAGKSRRPRLGGQDILDHLDIRVPPKESSKEKE